MADIPDGVVECGWLSNGIEKKMRVCTAQELLLREKIKAVKNFKGFYISLYILRVDKKLKSDTY